MLMKNVEMDAHIQALSSVQAAGYRLPAKIGYAIERNIRMLRTAGEEYSKHKEEIIRTYGTDNGDGSIFLDPKNKKAVEAFNDMIQEIGLIEHDVDIFRISIRDFGDAEISISDMSKLMFMIE